MTFSWRQLSRWICSPLSLLYPPLCRNCLCYVYAEQVFCDECVLLLQSLVSLEIPVTKKYSMKLFAAARYAHPIKSLVLRKFTGDVRASKQLASLILERTSITNQQIDYLVPIPLHWTRYARRGFNQARVIADELSKALDVPVWDALKRQRATPHQSALASLEEREQNVKKVFAACRGYELKELFAGKTIMLVDDISTTGATMVQAAKVLARCSPKKVLGVVAAR